MTMERIEDSMDDNDWSGRVYDLSFKAMSQRMVFGERKKRSLGELFNGVGLAMISSIVGHQLLRLLVGSKVEQVQSNPTIKPTAGGNKTGIFMDRKTLRGTQYSMLLFSLKTIMDHFQVNLTEYQKGGVIGLICYLINRPLDQLQLARRLILLRENRTIGRAEAFRVVLKHDGWKGLYRHENVLAPASAYIHRSIYFGLFHRLSLDDSLPQAANFALLPLLASLGASASTFLIDKLRSTYLHVHHLRNTTLMKRGRAAPMHQEGSVSREVIGMLGRGEIKVSSADWQSVTVAVARNWVLLALFQIGQKKGGTVVKEWLGKGDRRQE